MFSCRYDTLFKVQTNYIFKSIVHLFTMISNRAPIALTKGHLTLTVILVTLATTVASVDVGFEWLFKTSNETFENFKVIFDQPLEDWIRGVYVSL